MVPFVIAVTSGSDFGTQWDHFPTVVFYRIQDFPVSIVFFEVPRRHVLFPWRSELYPHLICLAHYRAFCLLTRCVAGASWSTNARGSILHVRGLRVMSGGLCVMTGGVNHVRGSILHVRGSMRHGRGCESCQGVYASCQGSYASYKCLWRMHIHTHCGRGAHRLDQGELTHKAQPCLPWLKVS